MCRGFSPSSLGLWELRFLVKEKWNASWVRCALLIIWATQESKAGGPSGVWDQFEKYSETAYHGKKRAR